MAPAVVPRVQPPTAAIPFAPVLTIDDPVMLPPPLTTANVTAMPLMGLPY